MIKLVFSPEFDEKYDALKNYIDNKIRVYGSRTKGTLDSIPKTTVFAINPLMCYDKNGLKGCNSWKG